MQCECMGKRETWYAIGFVSDRLIRDLREKVRLERVTGALGCGKSAPVVAADNAPQGEHSGVKIRGTINGTER